jgi:hypothetical protein
MHRSAVVCKACQVVEHLSTVFAFVNLVPAVSVDVSSQVVSTSISTPADVTGKGLLPGVNTHVSAQVRSADELAATHLARIRPVRFHAIHCSRVVPSNPGE